MPDRSGDPSHPAEPRIRRPWNALPEPDVDGGRLFERAVAFARALKAAGIPTDPASAIDFARALTLIELGDREQVRAAGATVFVRRRDELEVYDRVFARFWRRRGIGQVAMPASLGSPDSGQPSVGPEGAPATPGDDASTHERGAAGSPLPGQGDGDDDEPIEGVTIAPDAYSYAEVVRHKQFDRMTALELADATRLIDLLRPRLERRPTRRHELHHHGRRLAPRIMFRRNLGTGGDLVEWVWQRPVRRPRPIVVLCDISGSMERQSRLLLRFVQALAASSGVRTEAFVFGTRLTRVTRLLRDRDRDRALVRVSEAVSDWAGGTRIGDSFREFNQRWARRVLRTSGLVIVVSDGWDRGDPELVRVETARLRRNCYRLIWLNPLAGVAGYQPLAAGMAAAYPSIDDFVPAGSVASLERLGELLAGMREPDRFAQRGRRTLRGWRARRTRTSTRQAATLPAPSPQAAVSPPSRSGTAPVVRDPPGIVRERPDDPFVARRLE
ncbi:MAG TPA: VWA domain-containing protein [Candidatus Limnocylindrales bacterium]